MTVSLKRLLRKKEVKELLSSMTINCKGSGIEIFNCQGVSLFYAGQKDIAGEKIVISDEGKELGWLLASSSISSTIVVFISYLLRQEKENKQLLKDTLEKYKELNLLYDVTEKLTAVLHGKDVVETIILEIKRIIKADYIVVQFKSEDTDEWNCVGSSFSDNSINIESKDFEKIISWVTEQGKADIINNIKDDHRLEQSFLPPVASIIFAPLKVKEKTTGTIIVSSSTQHDYLSSDLKLLSSLALQAAAAIENARLYKLLKDTFIMTVNSLVEALEKRDVYTGGHTRRVMEYSLTIGNAMGLQEKDINDLKLAAVLHDIGKIGIRDEVLLKQGKLTDEEYAIIKKHTIYAEEILGNINNLENIIPGVKHHHERYDGNGYPDGKKEKEIDLFARIIAVADAFDAMTTDRPYRKGLSLEEAKEELISNSDKQFDSKIVKAFMEEL